MDTYEKIGKSVILKFVERVLAQILLFILSIILSRLLSPSDYGIYSIATLYVVLIGNTISNGIYMIILQKTILSDIEISSITIGFTGVATLITFFFFLISPVLANYYGNSQLISVFRVSSLLIVLITTNSILTGLTYREMSFKISLYANIISILISSIIGIYMALVGMSYWSLIFCELIRILVLNIIMFICYRRIDWFKFSSKVINPIYKENNKFIVTNFFISVVENLQSFIISKNYNANVLGNVSKGKSLPSMLSNPMVDAINNVLIPPLSTNRTNEIEFKSLYRKTFSTFSLVSFPLMSLLFINSNDLIVLLYTEKWIGLAFFVKIFCIYYALKPINMLVLNIYLSIENNKMFRKLSKISNVLFVIFTIISIPLGLMSFILISNLMYMVCINIYSLWCMRRDFNYNISEQFSDIISFLLITAASLLFTQIFNLEDANLLIRLVIRSTFLLSSYLFFVFLVKRQVYTELFEFIKKIMLKNKK